MRNPDTARPPRFRGRLPLAALVPAAFAALLHAAPAAEAEVRLAMFEQAGCVYCERWDAEVGDAYHKTDEGRAAPLLRVDLRNDDFSDLELASRPVYTPTFVLLKDGVELSRLEGYVSEDFFWPLLARMLGEIPEGSR